MTNLEQQLKNPVWYSLKQTHQNFAVNYNNVLYYKPEICSFGAFLNENNTLKATSDYVKTSNNFFLVSEKQTPVVDENKIRLVKKYNGCQMVLKSLNEVPITEKIVKLNESYINEVNELICLVMPDFYRKGTFKMGDFYGIFKNNKLVAVAGQRMQTHLFVEISSVVTHPNYTKKGLASQLITYNTQQILKQNKIPILHTAKGNKAIPLYNKLGFQLTRDMNWWLYQKK